MRAAGAHALELVLQRIDAFVHALLGVFLDIADHDVGAGLRKVVRDGGAERLALDDPHEVARVVQVEHDERQIVLATHHDRGRVHHAELLGEHLIERQSAVADRARILHRIRRVDAVDFRRLDQHVGADLDRAQARGRVGGEERVAGAGREDRHAALLEMAYRAPADVVLANLVDLQRGQHARDATEPLERVLHRERVDHGGEHAHVVGRDAVHAGLGEPGAAEDVAAADHEAHLHAEPEDFGDLGGDPANDRGIDAVLLVAEQRLTAQLQKDSPIRRRALRHEPLAARSLTVAPAASAPRAQTDLD